MVKKISKDEDIDIDDNDINVDLVKVESNTTETPKPSGVERQNPSIKIKSTTPITSCLRNERVIVRHIPKMNGMVTNPNHILYGGMAENATKTLTVPRYSSGMYYKVLDDNEKAYLEDVMGLEYNALSIYKKENNFWDDANESGISTVRLTKQDNVFNLSDPSDYIRYKILIANKDIIAPSIQDVQDRPKATYQFYILRENDEEKVATENMSILMQCYKEFGKIDDNVDAMRTVIEIMENKPIAPKTKVEWLRTETNSLIQSKSKMFLETVKDPLLETKILIKNAIASSIISNRGNFMYLRKDNSPLCEAGEDPTLTCAAKFLNNPIRQEIKFFIEAQLKEANKKKNE